MNWSALVILTFIILALHYSLTVIIYKVITVIKFNKQNINNRLNYSSLSSIYNANIGYLRRCKIKYIIIAMFVTIIVFIGSVSLVPNVETTCKINNIITIYDVADSSKNSSYIAYYAVNVTYHTYNKNITGIIQANDVWDSDLVAIMHIGKNSTTTTCFYNVIIQTYAVFTPYIFYAGTISLAIYAVGFFIIWIVRCTFFAHKTTNYEYVS